MHPRTEELLRHLRDTRARLRAGFDATPEALRSKRPAPDRWSAVDVLEHLGIVERQVAAVLRRGLRAALANGPLPPELETASILAASDAPWLLDRERRFQAGAAVLPKGTTADDAWRALDTSRADLTELVASVDGSSTNSIRAPHPFFGELTFHQWIVFIGLHEVRHSAQIRDTDAALRTG